MSVKILLADDSVTIQKVIGIIFGGEEYSLTVVDNGKTAVDKALEITPDILLIDALMPGMSGYEVCERIRSIPELSAKPILLLTGSFEPFDETKARDCGADDFISKPFESQLIISKVSELCELAASRSFATTQAEPPTEVEPFTSSFTSPFAAPEEPPSAETESVSSPNDIWNAFTPTEPPSEPIFPHEEGLAPDVSAAQSVEHGDSPWPAMDDLSHSFAEETLSAPPSGSFPEPEQAAEVTFGEISFAETTFESAPIEPAETILAEEPLHTIFEEPDEPADLYVATTTEAVAPAAAVPAAEATAPAALSEEQLKAAISALSRDVIERVVWEVVPDLAEVLIKEAIRRIKEG